jgi:glutamate/tyrosine decarboxylase-like PLP-dependent enzyme
MELSMSSRSDLLQRARDLAAAYLEEIPRRHVAATATGDQLRAAMGQPMPDDGVPAEQVLDDLAALAATGTAATQGPRHFGFVIGGSLPVATGADWLVSAWDQNAGVYVLSPLAAVAEETAARWLCELAGVGPSWTVGFVSGCQMASFTALAAARHHVLAAEGWDVEARGLFGAPPIDVVVSDESHYTIVNALRLLGLGGERLHRVGTDEQGRMRADALQAILADGSGPCVVCAQAGNVNTGAFDPLNDIADLARTRGAWLHVDGAFGFWARASASLSPLVAGIERADSIAIDGHKWLNVPYDSGIVFCAHGASHRRAMTLGAAYIIEDERERDPHEFVPEESRRARGIPVYAALRHLGRKGLAALIERNVTQAQHVARRLAAHPRVTILNDVVLNQVLVRVDHGTDNADAATRETIARVQADGTCWVGGTTWHGMAAMRISVSNWSTTIADMDRSAEAILALIPRP